MVLRRCDSCHLRPQDKFNWLSLAWFNSDGERLAHKMRLCDRCLAEDVGKYVEPIDMEERLHCPSCHIDTDSDYEAVYGTLIMPGYERETLEIPFCGSCKNIFTNWASQFGESLEDRRGADSGPSTHPSGLEVLRSMGIQPRAR